MRQITKFFAGTQCCEPALVVEKDCNLSLSSGTVFIPSYQGGWVMAFPWSMCGRLPSYFHSFASCHIPKAVCRLTSLYCVATVANFDQLPQMTGIIADGRYSRRLIRWQSCIAVDDL